MRFLVRIASLCLVLVAGKLAQAETLMLGSINDDVRKHIEQFTPLADYLEEQLADQGITRVGISVLPTAQDMTDAMRVGDVDLYFDSPVVAAHVARQAGGEPFLRRWKNGVGEYHSIIIVPNNSSIRSLYDLEGVTIGFQGPSSTSGFMLPVALVRETGIPLRELEGTDDSPAGDEIGFVFTGDDRNTILWLAQGLIGAGATDPRGLAWLEDSQPGAFRSIARSADVPRQVVVRRGGMDAALSARIEDVLRDMSDTSEGQRTMALFNDTTCFDDFPDGVEATFEPIYQLLDELNLMGVI